MKNSKNRYSNFSLIFYIIIAVITLGLFFISFLLEEKDGIPNPFPNEWYANEQMTEPANLRHPVLEDKSASFYALVPDGIRKGDCLWFKSKNAFITVFVGGEIRAQITPSNYAVLYGKTSGTDWVSVPLETADAGSVIFIAFEANYDDDSAYIDSMYLDSELRAVRYTLSGRIFGTISCLLLLFVGTILVVVYLVLGRRIKGMPKEMLWLGFFTFFTTMWTFSELRVMQVFTGRNAGVFHNLTCMSLMLCIMPLIYYYKNDLDRQNKYITPVMTAVTVLNFVLCNFLHFTGIADFHETLTASHINIGLGAVCVVYANYLRLFKNPERMKEDIPPAVFMVLIAVAAVVDVMRYRSGAVSDSAFFTRITLFLYVIALGIRSLAFVIDLMKKGMKADIISHLAYEDGLTGLGNRTAYQEKVEEIEGKETTIFVFDINNLKYVNDNIGHQVGDELIKSSADLIIEVFGNVGNCYRIGGDEFVCLAEGERDAETLTDEFYNYIYSFNQSGTLDFPLMIALGYEIYKGEGSIKDAINTADHRMYIKKADLKKLA